MTDKRATRRCSNQRRANATQVLDRANPIIADDFERGSLYGGLTIAVSFGLMFVAWGWWL